jgi:hypothetical protein
MKRWNLACLLLLLAAILSACGTSDSATLYQLRLKQGDSYRILMTMDQHIEQSVLGKTQQTSSLSRLEMSYTVTAVDSDGTMHIDAVYEKIALDMKGPTGTVKYDSADPSVNESAEQVSAMYDKMLGQKIALEFAPTGEIKSAAGMDALVDAIVDEMPEGPMREQFRQMFGDMFEQSMTGNSGNLALYPATPVKVGDTWPQTTTMSSSLFKVVLDTTYTLKERKDGVATIESVAVGNFEPGENGEMMGMKMDINLKGGQTGTLSVDEATGWTVRSQVKQDFAGAIMVSSPDNADMNLSIPMTMTMQITTEPVQ